VHEVMHDGWVEGRVRHNVVSGKLAQQGNTFQVKRTNGICQCWSNTTNEQEMFVGAQNDQAVK
jgi:hypothetical protein